MIASHLMLTPIKMPSSLRTIDRHMALNRLSMLAFGVSLLGGALLPASAAPITHYLTINPIRICNDSGSFCAPTPFYPNETYKIYSQVGVAPIFLPLAGVTHLPMKWVTTSGLVMPTLAPGQAIIC
jgi:hypothetical protein